MTAVVPAQLSLLACWVGGPRLLPAERRGRPVRSAIGKRRVPPGTDLELSAINLAGDDQADRTVHGGRDKAVYAYASEHLEAWRADLDDDRIHLDGDTSPFGENLSTAGATEDEVCIGDVWAWGDALLTVVQPRSPCFKLALHRGSGGVGPRMLATGRTGWYLRVLQPGTVPAGGPIEVVECHPAGLTVLDAHRAMFDRNLDDRDLAERLVALGDTLAETWRERLADRLSSVPG